MEATVILFVNGVTVFQFKEEASKLIHYPVCLGNISKDFPVIIWNKLD